jgi:hypothetical protein
VRSSFPVAPGPMLRYSTVSHRHISEPGVLVVWGGGTFKTVILPRASTSLLG